MATLGVNLQQDKNIVTNNKESDPIAETKPNSRDIIKDKNITQQTNEISNAIRFSNQTCENSTTCSSVHKDICSNNESKKEDLKVKAQALEINSTKIEKLSSTPNELRIKNVFNEESVVPFKYSTNSAKKDNISVENVINIVRSGSAPNIFDKNFQLRTSECFLCHLPHRSKGNKENDVMSSKYKRRKSAVISGNSCFFHVYHVPVTNFR